MGRDNEKQSLGDVIDSFGSFFIKTLGTILSYFGVPGVILVSLFYFIEKHASSTQKRDIIDTYVLFKNKNLNFIVLAIVVIFFSSIYLIQRNYWKKKEKLYKEEIDKCAERKSKLQNKLLAKAKLASSKKSKS